MEVLATGAKGIAVPYAGGHETEQTLRAKLLEQKGLIRQIPEMDLTVDALVNAVNATEVVKRQKDPQINLQGAEISAGLVSGWVGA